MNFSQCLFYKALIKDVCAEVGIHGGYCSYTGTKCSCFKEHTVWVLASHQISESVCVITLFFSSAYFSVISRRAEGLFSWEDFKPNEIQQLMQCDALCLFLVLKEQACACEHKFTY